ncbi:EAL domain-containing protein [Halomonas sp. YLGW01]|uniref:sensor domain-containing phosphodiesterase n=1 Tax=Halomonas sp. YLGW01 TaxID=2773308 RepID=UPI001782897E|nr:EAL domain-containing protein [Halomonas sp. YLGW01]
MDSSTKHHHLAGDTALVVLITGSIAIGGLGTLFSLLGLELHLPIGLRITLSSALFSLLAGLGLLALVQQHLMWRRSLSILLAGFALALLAESMGITAPRLDAEHAMHGIAPAVLVLMLTASLGLGVRGTLRRGLFKAIGGGLFGVGLVTLLVDLSLEHHGLWRELKELSASLPSGFLLSFGLAMRYVADNQPRLPLALSRRHRDVAVIGVTLSALGWLLIGWQQHRVEARQAGHVADVIELTSETVIGRHEQLMQRMAERWAVLGGLPDASLQTQEADSYLRDHLGLQGLAFIDGQGELSWHRARDVAALTRLETSLDDDMRQRLLTQEETIKWVFLDPTRPLEAFISIMLPAQAPGRLIARVDIDLLLTGALHPELLDHDLHLSQDGVTVAEVAPGDHEHEASPGALQPLATRDIDFACGHVLGMTLFGGPPSPWSASALLSTGVGAGSLILSYLLAFSFGLMRLSQTRARQLDHTHQQLQLQYRAQSLIARESACETSLETVCRMLERQLPGVYCSIMLCNDTQTVLKDAIAPSLPRGYLEQLKSVEIGPGIGACGTAAHTRKPVICEELATDRRWEQYRELVQRHGLAACWSFPLVASSGQVLGTMALYRTTPGVPDDEERQLAIKATDLVVLAIERHRDRQALVDSEQRYRSLFTHHPDAVFSMDLDGTFLSLNPRAAELTGVPTNEMLGQHFSCFVESTDMSQGQALFESARDGHALRYELQSRDAQGERHALDVTAIPMLTGDRITGVFGIAKDITAHKADETRLRVLERSVEASVNGVIIVDATLPDMPIIFANHAFSRITGYGNAEIKGRNCRFLQGPDTAPEAVEELRRGLAAERDTQVTLCNYRKNGEPFWNDLHISPVRNDQGELTHYIGVISDVSQRIADQATLAHQASHDSLTGAYNRTMFEQRLCHEAERARQGDTLLVVLFIDLDDFKPINDTLGHAMGDRLLMAVAERLSEALRPDDTLGRFGGDEFLVLLPDLAHERQAQAIVERVLAALSRPYQIDDHAFRLSASIGMASSREISLQHPEQLIVRADGAMYAAKKQGGNTAHWYRYQPGQSSSGRVELRKDIQEAIEQEQFSLHYQPLMNRAGEVLSYEALIRWQHPVKGPISPASFIPVAEITGQIVPIGDWVLTQVCRDLPRLRQLSARNSRVAINLSPMQFQRPNFLNQLQQRLEAHRIPPHWLELEVTEGVLMEDQDVAISILHALRELGVGVAIDDFGTGFSSLSYLKQLPVSKIKIDRSFIRDLAVDESDRAIVQGTLSMAHHMGLEVVAEGVETEEQLQYLTRFGCDIFQGYLLARPMPLDQLQGVLTTSA